MAGNYGGYGADISASAVLTVTNNVFQTNSSSGLYFIPSGTETAVVVVSNNVFSGSTAVTVELYINNFGTPQRGRQCF